MLFKLLKRRWFRYCGFSVAAAAIVIAIVFHRYHRTHPLVFGESFFSHEHCIKQAISSLLIYASEHNGVLPYHTNGFGDALLLVDHAWLPSFTGPGYTTEVFKHARATGGDVPEEQSGRIYVQGLTETNDFRIAILFDRDSSPGDHKHGFARMNAKPVREVGFRDGSMKAIPVEEWAKFAAEQIELLVAAGFSRELARSFYQEL